MLAKVIAGAGDICRHFAKRRFVLLKKREGIGPIPERGVYNTCF